MRHIKEYVASHMEEEMPDHVVIIGGGNDLSGNASISEIAAHIIDAGITCRIKGALKVSISSVLPRRDSHYQGRRHQLNGLLRNLCMVNNFEYIDNSNIIVKQHVAYDEVHLNRDGTKLLQDNLLDCLNA